MSKLLRQLRISNLASPDDFEAANRRQQIYGGSLDTVILELRILEPAALDEQLAQASGLPTVPADLLRAGLERPWDAIPPALVDLGWAMPLARDDNRVQVAVHPEIPDEQLDLIRDQPGLELMVTAECCLARLGSERTGSLTPQRYAILAASYLQGIGAAENARPLAEAAGAPWKQNSVARKSEPTLSPQPKAETLPAAHLPSGPIMPPPSQPGGAPPSWAPKADEPAAAAPATNAPVADNGGATLARVTPVQRQAGAIEKTPPPPSFSLPPSGSGFGRSFGYSSNKSETPTKKSPFNFQPPPSQGRPSETDTLPEQGREQALSSPGTPPLSPPVDPSASTSGSRPKSRSFPKIEAFDATDLRRRFEAARTRDEITDILLAGASALLPKVVLLAVRKSGLKWLSANDRVEQPAQPLVPFTEALHAAIHSDSHYGRCEDPQLRAAVDEGAAVPCALMPVKVAGRPVLAVYVDASGATIDDDDVESIRDLSNWAGLALTRVVRSKAESRKDASSAPSHAPATPTFQNSDDSDSISLRPHPASPQSGTSTLPPLVVPQRAPEPAAPILSRTPPPAAVPSPVPTGTTPSPPISPKVPRLIDKAPPRSTTLISTTAPPESSTPLAATSLEAPPIRDLGAPVKPGSMGAVPNTIPPVRTPAPPVRGAAPIRGGAPPVRRPPQRDGTLSPQMHVPDNANIGVPDDDDEAEAPPIDDTTLIPTSMPVPPPAAAPAAAAPPVRHTPPPVRRAPPASRSETLTGHEPPERVWRSPGNGGRGGLILDDEDRHDDSAERSSERIPRDVLDATIDRAMVDPTGIPALLELGEPALSRLGARFPGPLDVMRRDLNNLPPLSAHGPLIRLAVQLGQRVSPMIRELLDHPDAKVRFYAAFTFQELRDEMVLDGLATRAFDSDGDVRAIAMRVLETYSRASTYSSRIAPIRGQLNSDNMTRQIHAARAVGTLRDVDAVPALMALLDHGEKRIRDIGLESLCSITGQQLGSRSSRWRSWYETSKQQHRVEWIIGALSHKDAGVRAWASIELRRITGQPYALPVEGSKREREQVIKQWNDWWNRQGRDRFGG